MVLGAIKKLFGGGRGGEAGETAGETIDYQGYRITPAPKPHNGQYLTAGYIRKGEGDGGKEHHFIRADTHASIEQAMSFSVTKAQQIIDQQGDRLFR